MPGSNLGAIYRDLGSDFKESADTHALAFAALLSCGADKFAFSPPNERLVLYSPFRPATSTRQHLSASVPGAPPHTQRLDPSHLARQVLKSHGR